MSQKQNDQETNSLHKVKYYSKEEYEKGDFEGAILECFSVNTSDNNKKNKVRGYLLTLQG